MKKYLEKTLKTWENHGFLWVSRSGNPGTCSPGSIACCSILHAPSKTSRILFADSESETDALDVAAPAEPAAPQSGGPSFFDSAVPQQPLRLELALRI